MFGCYTNYIPDLTERYPEGFRTFDEPDDYGYDPSDNYHDKRFYALNDGRIYYKEDGHDLKLLEENVDVVDFQDQGFELIGPYSYQSNINILNEMIVRM